MRILFLEDDQSLGRSLKLALELENLKVEWAQDLRQARAALKKELFDLHILDWNLPDGTGIELAKEILEIGVGAKIIFLTAKSDEESAVKALQLGALDFVRKPFGVKELIMRIKRAGDRKIESEDIINFEGLGLDLNTRELLFNSKRYALPPKESLILEALLENPGEPVSRERLIQRCGFDVNIDERTVDSHLSHLRAKIKKLGETNLEIKALYGAGYVLKKK